MRSLAFSFAMLVACGSSPPAATPAAPPAADCPSDIATLVGKPCPTNGAHCGDANGSGFSNIVVCQGGSWTHVEVPPPPPGG